jgi:hypothetical protein
MYGYVFSSNNTNENKLTLVVSHFCYVADIIVLLESQR